MLRRIISFAILLLIVLQLPAQLPLRFDFGTAKARPGYSAVMPGMAYDSLRGFGFEAAGNLSAHTPDAKDAARGHYISADGPFSFSVRLPEGNYNVRVLLGDRAGVSQTTIKAECRRVMLPDFRTGKGEVREAFFTVHVRDSIIRPAGTRVRLKPRELVYRHWDDRLTLEFNGPEPKVCALVIDRDDRIPTVFLAGNSTVVDQAEEPYAAWGQLLPAFFEGGKVAIANYAESGETLKAFQRERRTEKLLSLAKAGDYLFIEFAHNDQKPGGNHLDPFTSYSDTLRSWIRVARTHGMQPVLVTSMHRRSFDSSGHIVNTLGDYPEAVRRVAREQGVPLIDLNAMSRILYEALGPGRSVKAFVHFKAGAYPNQPKDVEDNTHFSSYGAWELARCVLEGIRAEVPALAKFLRKDAGHFDPAHPDDPERWKLPQSRLVDAAKPDGN
jgi:lysophospholipase L1-like esterase